MAVQFPNFLSVPVRTPDYSGIGDLVSNFYAGSAMPKDDLIKKVQAQFSRPNAEKDFLIKSIQAEFARPKAEQELLSSRLSNRQSQLTIDKTLREMAEQKALVDQFKQAMSGGAPAPASAPAPMSQPMQNVMPNAVPNAMNAPIGLTSPQGINPALVKALSQSAPQGDASFQSMVAGLPQTQSAPQPEVNEVVISKGSPHLAGIDAMYDSNPLSRAFLEKKGYEKKQEIKFDNKTGKTTIITKYPSGKVTVQSSGGEPSDEGAPLTSKMVSKHQGIISAVDTVIPVINQILAQPSYPLWSIPVIGSGDEMSNYDSLVNQGLDTLMSAFGLPITNEGMKSVKSQLEIGHMETKAAYRKRLKRLIEDLRSRQKYSADQLKKKINIENDDSEKSENSDPYGLNSYDNAGDNSV